MAIWAQNRDQSASGVEEDAQHPPRRKKTFSAVSSLFLRSAQNQDLRRFLQEVFPM